MKMNFKVEIFDLKAKNDQYSNIYPQLFNDKEIKLVIENFKNNNFYL